jgi:hypothetical protein
MVNTEITKFTKLYVSNKNSNQKLYFAIDYEIRIIKYNNEQTTTSIILYISYLYLEKDFVLEKLKQDLINGNFHLVVITKVAVCIQV